MTKNGVVDKQFEEIFFPKSLLRNIINCYVFIADQGYTEIIPGAAAERVFKGTLAFSVTLDYTLRLNSYFNNKNLYPQLVRMNILTFYVKFNVYVFFLANYVKSSCTYRHIVYEFFRILFLFFLFALVALTTSISKEP